MITYPIGSSGQILVFQAGVIAHVMAHRQLHWWQNEAGGQLFARFADSQILVAEATGPRPGDRRTRYSYRSDAHAEQREIDWMHAFGLHYVGDWHTHPQREPAPSTPDLESIAESVRKSTHNLNGFVLMVVGRAAAPAGLHVSVHDGVTGHRLSPSLTVESASAPATRRRQIRWI